MAMVRPMSALKRRAAVRPVVAPRTPDPRRSSARSRAASLSPAQSDVSGAKARDAPPQIPHGYFTDVESWRIGPELWNKRVHLVPVKDVSDDARRAKKAEIARHYKVRGPVLFLHVNLLDNRSEFSSPFEGSLRRDGGDYVAEVYGAPAIANTIAFISEAIDPISIILGLTRRGLMGQAVRYLLFGEGETGLMVYTILLRHWDWTPEEDVRPLIFLMSD
jgi:hypothetical protein